MVELFHGHGPSPAAGDTLAGLGRAGVVAVPAALAGAQGHRHPTGRAEADAGKEGWPADDAWRRPCRAPRPEMGLYGLELCHLDDGWDHHLDNLSLRLTLA